MLKYLILLLALSCAYATVKSVRKPGKPATECCPKNEHLEECGTACPRTCKDRNPQVCTKLCVKGCFCDDGYVRETSSGKCIPPKECPTPVCPKDEVWNSCGTACPKTCKNKDIKIKCTADCKEGCFCKKGLVRNDAGKCINPKKCPVKECSEDEEWNSCGTACPKTCKNKDIKIKCTADCKEGCFCKKGLVRNDAGKCINPKKCQVTPKPRCNNPK